MEFMIPIPSQSEVTSWFSKKWSEFVNSFHSQDFNRQSKKSFLLHYGSQTINNIRLKKMISEEEFTRWIECLETLENQCLFQIVICFLRHLFFTHCQQGGTSLEEFYAELRVLSELCSFEDGSREDLIKEQIISNIRDKSARDVFLSYENLTAVNILEVWNLADKQRTIVTPDLINTYFMEKLQKTLCTSDCLETNSKKDSEHSTVLLPETRGTDVTNQTSLFVNDVQYVNPRDSKITQPLTITDVGAQQNENDSQIFINVDETINDTVIPDTPVLVSNEMLSPNVTVVETNKSESCTYFTITLGSWDDNEAENNSDDSVMSREDKNSSNNEPCKGVNHISDSNYSDREAMVRNLPNYSLSRDLYFSEVPLIFITKQSAILKTSQPKGISGHILGVYSCRLCKFTSTKEMIIKDHALYMHTSLDCYICNVCNSKFPSKYQIESHVRLKHLNGRGGEQKCQFCDEVFNSQTTLFQHLQKHSQSEVLSCNVCFATFLSKVLLCKHMFDIHSVSNMNEWVCQICMEIYPTRTALSDHVSEVHKDQKWDDNKGRRTFCKFCNICFSDSKSKEKHYRKIHPKKKKPLIFSCNQCDYRFSSRTKLISHQRTHTGERPYMCEFCSKGFSQSASFTIHRRIHTGERPYKCQYCEVRFLSSSNKLTHERRHRKEKRHICDLCGRGFLMGRDLRNHIKCHDKSQEKQFACSCGSMFLRRRHLLRHQKNHSGLKTDVCELCGAGFTRPENLRAHQKSQVCRRKKLINND